MNVIKNIQDSQFDEMEYVKLLQNSRNCRSMLFCLHAISNDVLLLFRFLADFDTLMHVLTEQFWYVQRSKMSYYLQNIKIGSKSTFMCLIGSHECVRIILIIFSKILLMCSKWMLAFLFTLLKKECFFQHYFDLCLDISIQLYSKLWNSPIDNVWERVDY